MTSQLNGNHNSPKQRREWTPSSWQDYPIKQQPKYADAAALEKALAKVKALPPLVHQKEILALKQHLGDAGEGKKFIIQGGDCAERFLDCSSEPIENKFKILLQMSLIILWGSRVPVVRIARMAGQYAKPRSADFETKDGKQIFSFKGDNINDFDASNREPDPDRMVQAYFHSAATLNYIRAMILGGVADLHHPRSWNLGLVVQPHVRYQYELIIDRITEAVDFLGTIQADSSDTFKSVEFYTSHEGMLLSYEEALTRKIKDKYFNLSAHFLWIGDRTRDINGAHIEYFRGIQNPIGVKVGPSMTESDLIELVRILNSRKEPGRLTLITRYGCNKIDEMLPIHIRAVQKLDIPVTWMCDPCHGNTEVTAEGIKTRKTEKMMLELIKAFEIHKSCGSFLGGVHLELTGDNVTECTGGSALLEANELSKQYETFCDPRLNYTQSLDFAFAVANQLKDRRTEYKLRISDF